MPIQADRCPGAHTRPAATTPASSPRCPTACTAPKPHIRSQPSRLPRPRYFPSFGLSYILPSPAFYAETGVPLPSCHLHSLKIATHRWLSTPHTAGLISAARWHPCQVAPWHREILVAAAPAQGALQALTSVPTQSALPVHFATAPLPIVHIALLPHIPAGRQTALRDPPGCDVPARCTDKGLTKSDMTRVSCSVSGNLLVHLLNLALLILLPSNDGSGSR